MGGVGADEDARDGVIKAGMYRSGIPRGVGPSAGKEPAAKRAPRAGEAREVLANRRLIAILRAKRTRLAEWKALHLPYLANATPKQVEAYRLHVESGLSVQAVADEIGRSKRTAQDRIEGAKRHERAAWRKAQIA